MWPRGIFFALYGVLTALSYALFSSDWPGLTKRQYWWYPCASVASVADDQLLEFLESPATADGQLPHAANPPPPPPSLLDHSPARPLIPSRRSPRTRMERYVHGDFVWPPRHRHGSHSLARALGRVRPLNGRQSALSDCLSRQWLTGRMGKLLRRPPQPAARQRSIRTMASLSSSSYPRRRMCVLPARPDPDAQRGKWARPQTCSSPTASTISRGRACSSASSSTSMIQSLAWAP